MKRASSISCSAKYISECYKWAKRGTANVMFQNREWNKIKKEKENLQIRPRVWTARDPRSWAQNYKLLTSQICTFNIHSIPPPSVALRPNARHGLLVLEVSRLHTTTQHIR